MNAQTLPKIEELNVQESGIIDVDMPFNAKEVEQATSKRYVEQLTRSDMPIVAARRSFIAADNKKNRASIVIEHVFDPIDVDMPFSAAEMTALTSEAYVAALGPSDMPVVGHWGQFAPSACKVLVIDHERNAVSKIRENVSKKESSAEETFTCTDALA